MHRTNCPKTREQGSSGHRTRCIDHLTGCEGSGGSGHGSEPLPSGAPTRGAGPARPGGQASLTPALDAPREGRPIDQRACVAVGGRHCRHGETRAEVHGGEAAAHVTPLFGDSTGDGIAQTELPVRVCACGEQIPVQRFLDQTLAIGTRCRARQKNSPQHLSVPSLSVAQQCPASGSCCTHPTIPGPQHPTIPGGHSTRNSPSWKKSPKNSIYPADTSSVGAPYFRSMCALMPGEHDSDVAVRSPAPRSTNGTLSSGSILYGTDRGEHPEDTHSYLTEHS